MNQDSILKKYEQVRLDSEFVKEAVRALVYAASRDLDEAVDKVRENLRLIKEGTMETYDDETMELQIINFPVVMYYVSQKIEEYAADEEVSIYRRKEIYNEIVVRGHIAEDGARKTVKDKTAEAEFASAEEKIVTEIFTIALRELKLKLDHSKMVYEALKKVMDARTASYYKKLS